MIFERTRAAGRSTRHGVSVLAAAALLVLAGASAGNGQTPPAKQAQEGAQPPAGQAQSGQTPPMSYTPWTKLCNANPNAPQVKPICLTMMEARLETGQFLVGAALVEQEGEQRKAFRVTLPLGMQIGPGTRVIIDQNPPLTSHYFVCTEAGCLSEYQVNADFVTKLKSGRQLLVQGINLQGEPASYPLPLGSDFVKANEGPPTDPKDAAIMQPKR